MAESLKNVASENIIRKDGFTIVFPFLGTAGATAANYDQVMSFPRAMELVEVNASWSTASSSGTLQLERLEDGVAPGSGENVLAAAISTAGAANTVVTRLGRDLTRARLFKPGDRLAFKDGGTLTNLVGLQVTLYFFMAGRGDYR